MRPIVKGNGQAHEDLSKRLADNVLEALRRLPGGAGRGDQRACADDQRGAAGAVGAGSGRSSCRSW